MATISIHPAVDNGVKAGSETTGPMVATPSLLGRPGVGPSSGEATQLAISPEGALKLTRSSE